MADRPFDPRFPVAPAKAALLVVDMQNDFVDPGGAFPVPGIEAAASNLSRLLDRFRKLVRPVIFTRHVSDPTTNPIELLVYPGMAVGGLRKGTWGWEIHPSLAPLPGETVLDKRRFDAFLGTGLEALLRSAGAEDLVLGGCQTQICCDTTARAASCRDFRVTLLSDACASRSPSLHLPALQAFHRSFGQVLSTDQVLQMLPQVQEE